MASAYARFPVNLQKPLSNLGKSVGLTVVVNCIDFLKLGLHSLLTENFIEKQIEAIFLHDFFLLQLRLRNPICLLLVFVFSFSERNYI